SCFRPHSVAGDEGRCYGRHQRADDGVETVDLLLKALDPLGQVPEGKLGGAGRRRRIPGTKPRCVRHQANDGGSSERLAELLRAGDDEGPHLVEAIDTAAAGRTPYDSKSPQGLNISGPA